MTARSPVEFTDRQAKRVGNEVVLATTNGMLVSVDDIVRALVVQTVEHHEIHEGETFVVSYKSPDGAAIADNGTILYSVVTLAKQAHIIIDVECGGDAELEILENAVFTGGTGTAMASYNKNRQSPKMPLSTVRRGVTITNPGTLIFNKFLPGGTGGNAQGVSINTRDEWMLKTATVYIIRATNRAGNAQQMSLAIEWYEELPL